MHNIESHAKCHRASPCTASLPLGTTRSSIGRVLVDLEPARESLGVAAQACPGFLELEPARWPFGHRRCRCRFRWARRRSWCRGRGRIRGRGRGRGRGDRLRWGWRGCRQRGRRSNGSGDRGRGGGGRRSRGSGWRGGCSRSLPWRYRLGSGRGRRCRGGRGGAVDFMDGEPLADARRWRRWCGGSSGRGGGGSRGGSSGRLDFWGGRAWDWEEALRGPSALARSQLYRALGLGDGERKGGREQRALSRDWKRGRGHIRPSPTTPSLWLARGHSQSIALVHSRRTSSCFRVASSSARKSLLAASRRVASSKSAEEERAEEGEEGAVRLWKGRLWSCIASKGVYYARPELLLGSIPPHAGQRGRYPEWAMSRNARPVETVHPFKKLIFEKVLAHEYAQTRSEWLGNTGRGALGRESEAQDNVFRFALSPHYPPSPLRSLPTRPPHEPRHTVDGALELRQ